MSQPIQQHEVPRFYLEYFAGSDGVWTFDKHRDGASYVTSAENTAVVRHRYSVTNPDGSKDTRIEAFLSNVVESKAKIATENLLSAGHLDGQMRVDFAYFVANTYARSEATRRQYAELRVHSVQLRDYLTAKHDGAFKTHMEKYQKAHGNLTAQEIADLRDAMLNPQNYTVTINREATVGTLKYADKLAPIIFNMRWTILEAEKGSHFVTSDNPVLWRVPPLHAEAFYDGGIAHKKVELRFPLTKTLCLLANWEKDTPRRFTLDDDLVAAMNNQTAESAERFLYAHENSDAIKELAKRHKDNRAHIQMSGRGPKEYSPVTLRRSNEKPAR